MLRGKGEKKEEENGTQTRTPARAETKDDKLRVCIVFIFLSRPFDLFYGLFFGGGGDKAMARARKLKVS